MEAEKKPFETWAIVELMGHHQIAGRATEESIAGQNMLRVDVPAVGERLPHTKYFGGGSIYAIHPCTEAIACAAAERLATRWGYTPLPVAVPDLTEAMDTIKRAEAARASTPVAALSAGREEEEDWQNDDQPF